MITAAEARKRLEENMSSTEVSSSPHIKNIERLIEHAIDNLSNRVIYCLYDLGVATGTVRYLEAHGYRVEMVVDTHIILYITFREKHHTFL